MPHYAPETGARVHYRSYNIGARATCNNKRGVADLQPAWVVRALCRGRLVHTHEQNLQRASSAIAWDVPSRPHVVSQEHVSRMEVDWAMLVLPSPNPTRDEGEPGCGFVVPMLVNMSRRLLIKEWCHVFAALPKGAVRTHFVGRCLGHVAGQWPVRCVLKRGTGSEEIRIQGD